MESTATAQTGSRNDSGLHELSLPERVLKRITDLCVRILLKVFRKVPE